MDKTDKSLLQALQRDASPSMSELAEAVNLSKTATWRRVKNLQDNGVIKCQVALLDAQKVGLGLSAYISIRTSAHNQLWMDQFKGLVESISGVQEVYRMSGELDYLIKAQVRDIEDYDRLYKQLIRAELTDVSASFVMETLKHTTELPLDNL
ncbi:MAG: Lrp/AsnC family transcriptional regulator [Cellvibrionaceae bacterium]|nr:Lrp/AsnC family transcriptional regulator [Cellvibrionaceae bacterium]MCV6627433.1 Lrp/AsnC family transcriptional regulator [Cellvibrionaceae bacterium]